MKIKDIIPSYLKHLKAIGRSDRTITGTSYDLRPFMHFLEEGQVLNLDDLTADVMTEYQQELAFRISGRGTLLSLRSQAQLLGVAKGFTRYLKQRDYLMHDPGEDIKVPRKPKTLPRAILTEAEVRCLLHAPNTRTNKGYRDRIILEILYDTAIRRDEMINITVADLDLNAGFVRIHGKGSKDRVVPMSDRVCDLVKNYILSVRPHCVQGKDPGYLILNRWGAQMKGNNVWVLVKQYKDKAGIKKNVTTHALRHTCATHMLKNGAPVRHIQEMLGHESLESTQIYTRVTINDLKEVHAKYHPGETLTD
jgi:integrase/recombinase XerD